jgi:CarD family transcriptional regulator
VRLAVGTVVVHPTHGVGRVRARESRLTRGVTEEVAVIDLDNGLSVTMPLGLARGLLRSPIDEPGIRRIEETLREDGVASDEDWSKRVGQAQAKLKNGDPFELAEIVRDAARRERANETASGQSRPKLSASERSLYVKARELLSAEIGFVLGLSQAEANVWIDEQLAAGQS